MKKLIFILTMVVLVSSFLCADIYVKNMKRTRAYEMKGQKQPERIRIEEQWVGKNKFAVITKEVSIVCDFEKEEFYFIIHKNKEYYQFPANIDRAKLQEILPLKIADIIKSMKITDAKVYLDGGIKKVGNWNCYGSNFEMVIMIPAVNIMPRIRITMWTTHDVPFDYKSYTEPMGEFFKRFFLEILDVDENSKKEMEKLDKVEGIQVAGEATITFLGFEIKEESQCLELAEKPAPAGIYSVPAGYAKKTIALPQN